MFFVPISRDSRTVTRLLDGSDVRFLGKRASTLAPPLDVVESELAYTACLDVPGVGKDDVKVTVEGRRVTVKAEPLPAAAAAGQSPGEAPPESRLVHQERPAVSYARSFTLPVEVEHAEAGAKLENGVLTLTLPKRNARAAARITIN